MYQPAEEHSGRGHARSNANVRRTRSATVFTDAVVKCWKVDQAGYSSTAAKHWDEDRQPVTRVVFDADFSGAGMTNFACFCHSIIILGE